MSAHRRMYHYFDQLQLVVKRLVIRLLAVPGL